MVDYTILLLLLFLLFFSKSVIFDISFIREGGYVILKDFKKKGIQAANRSPFHLDSVNHSRCQVTFRTRIYFQLTVKTDIILSFSGGSSRKCRMQNACIQKPLM